MELTKEQQEIYDGLSDYYKTVMGYTSIIMKKYIRNRAPEGYVPKWMQKKIDYLVENGFVVEKRESEKETVAEADISNATFEQRLKIWDIEPIK